MPIGKCVANDANPCTQITLSECAHANIRGIGILLVNWHYIMWLKYPIIILLFLLLTLFQVSFLPHVSSVVMAPDLVFLFFFLLIFFQSPNQYSESIVVTVIAGFMLDIFLMPYSGVATVSLLLTLVIIQTAFYFLKERQGKYVAFYFIAVFLIAFTFYHAIIFLFIHSFHTPALLPLNNIGIELVWNLAIALIAFGVAKMVIKKTNRQLTLFGNLR